MSRTTSTKSKTAPDYRAARAAKASLSADKKKAATDSNKNISNGVREDNGVRKGKDKAKSKDNGVRAMKSSAAPDAPEKTKPAKATKPAAKPAADAAADDAAPSQDKNMLANLIALPQTYAVLVRDSIVNFPSAVRAWIFSQADTKLKGEDTPILQIVLRVYRNYTLPYWKPLAFATGTNIMVASVTGLTPWLIQQAVDQVFQQHNPRMLIILPAVMLAAALMKAGATFAAGYSMAIVDRRMMFDVQRDVFKSFVRADLATVEKQHAGSHMMIFTHAARGLQKAIGTSVVTVMRQAVSVLALIIVMFTIHFQFAVIYMALVLPATIGAIKRASSSVQDAAKSELVKAGNMMAGVSDMLSGLRIIKAYQLERDQTKRNELRIDQALERALSLAKTQSLSTPMSEMLAGFAVAAIIFYGGILSVNGQVTTGQFVGFVTALLLTYQPLKAVMRLNITLGMGFMAARRVFAIIDAPSEAEEKSAARKALKIKDGSIEFDHVSYTYPGQQEPALQDIHFTVPGGKNVALVGPSGAGKSTLANLIPRFFEPTDGAVRIDGQDISKVSLTSLRKVIGLVTQEPFLFDTDIYNNLLAGKPSATKKEVEAAAQNAAAADFIEALGDKYQSDVGQNGKNLSGGERQRLAIARAMLKNAPILLLDEATSALDNASEEKIQDGLKRLLKGRTALIIAHRLSTILDADLVLVMNQGQMVQMGTHEELLAQEGMYRKLFHKQFLTSIPAELTVEQDIRDVRRSKKIAEVQARKKAAAEKAAADNAQSQPPAKAPIAAE